MNAASTHREFEIHSVEETDAFGKMLAKHVPSGTCIGLVGTLGAGKTRLVQSLIQAHGIPRDEITSPTFALMHTFESKNPDLPHRVLYHLDAYRLRDEDEFYELGIEEFIERPNTLTLIEWADRVANALPESTLWIEIEWVGQQQRRIRLEGSREPWESILAQMHKEYTYNPCAPPTHKSDP